MKVDLAIVGGGIAGSALALVMARQGLDVVLIEREATFRDRVRGEAIHPWGTRELDRLQLRQLVLDDAAGRELPIWQTYRQRIAHDPFAWASLDPSIPPELTVRHAELQEVLITAAAEAGVRVHRPATVLLDREPRGPRVTIRHHESEMTVLPRLLVGADGTHSMTRRWLGGRAERDPVHHFMGGSLIAGLDLPPEAAHQAVGEGGFGMIFPQSGELSRVYLICTPEQRQAMIGEPQPGFMMQRVCSYFPEGMIGDWKPAGPTAFFPNADVVSSLIAGPEGDAVLIGDAAGTNDPSSGHGLSLVFWDVRVLSDLLRDQADWRQVPALFATERTRYYGVVRAHAQWNALLIAETGAEADARRDRVARAREIDPTAGGYAALYALGPDGLDTGEDARGRFLGEDV